jgi:DNA modification methylase
MGAGTTALVAKELGRNYIGIELNKEYVKIAERGWAVRKKTQKNVQLKKKFKGRASLQGTKQSRKSLIQKKACDKICRRLF